MQPKRTALEQLTFKIAELDAAMHAAGFQLAFSDPQASRDFSYRARYIRSRSTLFPLLNATFEYYLATGTFSLVISTSDELKSKVFACRVKQHKGDLRELLDRYFAAVRRGEAYAPQADGIG